MKQVFKFDANGYFVEPVLIKDGAKIPPDCTEIMFTDGMYKPQWDGTQWVEGLTPEELEVIKEEQERQKTLPTESKRLLDVEDALFELMLYP